MTTIPETASPVERFTSSVLALAAGRRISPAQMRVRLGIGKTAWHDRLNKNNWSLAESQALAELFGTTIQAMMDGQVTVPSILPSLELLLGQGLGGPVSRGLHAVMGIDQ